MNNNVIYTCITAVYDEIENPKFISDGFDYVCYTDNENLKSDVWEIRKIPETLSDLSDAKKNRYVKTHPHEFFPEYDISIYIDGNVIQNGDVNELIEKECTEGSIFFYKHPYEDCIYDELYTLTFCLKESLGMIDKLRKRYRMEKFPRHFGLSQNNIIIRRHNEYDCIWLMERWWEEIKENSHRDQVSLFYVLWKTPGVSIKLIDYDLSSSKYFCVKTHSWC